MESDSRWVMPLLAIAARFASFFNTPGEKWNLKAITGNMLMALFIMYLAQEFTTMIHHPEWSRGVIGIACYWGKPGIDYFIRLGQRVLERRVKDTGDKHEEPRSNSSEADK